MLPDVPVVCCHSCNHFFHEEDWELAVMAKGTCPFCRAKVSGSDSGSVVNFPTGERTKGNDIEYLMGALASQKWLWKQMRIPLLIKSIKLAVTGVSLLMG